MELQLPLPEDGLQHQPMQGPTTINQSIHTSRAQKIQSESTVAVATMPPKSRGNPANTAVPATTGPSHQPRTYISPQITRAPNLKPLTNTPPLTLADQRRVAVLDIGMAGTPHWKTAREQKWHYVTLQDVQQVPNWMCNVFLAYTSSKPPQSSSMPGRTLVSRS